MERILQTTFGICATLLTGLALKLAIAYLLHRCHKCARRRGWTIKRHAITFSAAQATVSWKRLPFSREETVALMMIVMIAPYTQACTPTANFQAEGRPQGSISITAQPILTCLPTDIIHTRPANLQVVSSRRCPGMGSWTGQNCARIPPDAQLVEFLPYKDLPVVTRYQEACACLLPCGCLLCGSGCLFYRIFAVADQESKPIVVNKCAWQAATVIEMQVLTAATKKRFSLLLHNGEVPHGNISVGLLSQTLATTVSAMWFAETEDTSAHLDEPQMADARLFTCTNVAARNCSLDPQSVSCHQADDVAVCDTSGNHLLQSALRTRVLPQFVDGQLVERRHGKTSVRLARAAVQVQIEMRNLTLLSRIDFTTCTAQVTNHRLLWMPQRSHSSLHVHNGLRRGYSGGHLPIYYRNHLVRTQRQHQVNPYLPQEPVGQ
ncbi:hypothetical protein QR680_009258 [Steinernema hermaphroditum]|uniref:Phlebovirus glycoprotein G2 fusion domain-containing protein n=1 Tax=Steinernema hermaphroditum TaxID=289476 RepID=A0AA39IL09_9BILA|nr:hypothetical protein QR680_009258 [Steinernema hermaphroditum]